MDDDEFWQLVESVRSSLNGQMDPYGKAFAAALTQRLSTTSTQTVLDFQERFDRANGAIYRWDVWAAAYLIGGGCSDDSFSDFRAGVVSLGRDWYERVRANPDQLAEHPSVMRAASQGDDAALFAEAILYAPARAYEQISGDDHAFYDARRDRRQSADEQEMGEDFDFDDQHEMRRRLPRLAELFLPAN